MKTDSNGVLLNAKKIYICDDCGQSGENCKATQCGQVTVSMVINEIHKLRATYEEQMQDSIGGKGYFRHKVQTLDEVLALIAGGN
jgi:hypothetical protein